MTQLPIDHKLEDVWHGQTRSFGIATFCRAPSADWFSPGRPVALPTLSHRRKFVYSGNLCDSVGHPPLKFIRVYQGISGQKCKAPRGKIGRLSKAVQEQVSRRLEHGEKARTLVAWLNARPEGLAMPAGEKGRTPAPPGTVEAAVPPHNRLNFAAKCLNSARHA